MHPGKWSLAALVVGLALAGCVENESTADDDDADARQIVVDVPDGATQVHVDVTADATAGEPDATILVEDDEGNNLASETFSIGSDTQRRVTVDASGHDRMLVTVRVVDGDATLDVHVSATVPDRSEPVVIVVERIVIVQTPPAQTTPGTTPTPGPTTPTPTSPTPTPTSPTPTPTSPTPTPTPPVPTPTPPTNTTNETNTSNTTA